MAITDIANVDISLQSIGVTRQGFGTPLFIDAHRYFEERVRAYSSLSGVAEDFPTTSASYRAAQQFFSNTPAPRTIKLGRREATAVVAVGVVAEGNVFSVTVNSGEDTVTASYTAESGDTAADVVAALKTAIDASAPINAATVTTVVGSTLEISATATFSFSVVAGTNTSLTFTTTETAADVMTAITEEDNDFYFVTSSDKTETFVLALAADIEARVKLYFVATSATASYGTLAVPAASGDILGKLKDAAYNRTVGMYAHNASTDHPECYFVGYNAPFDAGSVVWTNLVAALPVALSATGNVLTQTQQNNVDARNASFVRNEGGVNAIRGGKVASGEWIDNIRGRDNLQVDAKADITNLLLSQQGGKLPYTNAGLNAVRSVLAGTLDRYVARGFINPNYQISIPDVTQISAAKKQARLLDDITFRAELTGAIILVDVTGTLELEL